MTNLIKKEYNLFIGIDISKTVFDVGVISNVGVRLGHKKFKNDSFGFESCLEWLGDFYSEGEMVFCMEHTGVYSRLLGMFIQDRNFDLCMESGFVIKRAGGILKGKSDKIDSFRIAEFALGNRFKLKIAEPYDKRLVELHDLLTTRTRLKTNLRALTTPLGELKTYGGEQNYKLVERGCKEAIDGLKKSIKELDRIIEELIEQTCGLKERVELVTSVKGIGKVVCLWMIVYTQNFTENINARKFASLVGIAPFEEISGSSVRKGSHVSNHAHRFLKGLLHTSAMTAIRNSQRIKDYHSKKKIEGKKGFVIMNNIKNKLVQTVFAVVRSGIPYDEQFIHKKVA